MITPELITHYQHLWDTMIINHPEQVKHDAAMILSHIDKYIEVTAGTKVPPQFVGCLHYRESTCNFNTHLHNGDTLAHRTVHVPEGRPLGNPPFTWIVSARDALFTLAGLDKVQDWTLPNILYHFETYNGVGYLKHHTDILSPYVWSGTNHYQKGKYASDGKFDEDLIDRQLGCAPLFRYLTDKTLGLA